MSVAALLDQLEARGVHFRLDGDEIRFGPPDAVPQDVLKKLRAHRTHVLAELRSREDSLGLEEAEVRDTRVELVGCSLYSKKISCEVWLAWNDQVAAEIAAEHPGVPVLTFAEVPLLTGKPLEVLRAALEAKAQFVGARLRS